MYDLVIIGAGPAGLAAAVYAARQKIDFIMISSNIGGQTILSSDVENYLGHHKLSGLDLVNKFKEHLKDYEIDLKEGEKVSDIEKLEKGLKVITDKAEYETKTVLIVSGKQPRKLGVPGEDKLSRKGVTYCATCDAPIFAGKDVAVIGGGNAALDAALLSAKYANKIYMININPEFTGDKSLVDEVSKSDKIEVFFNAETTEILGGKFVEGVKFRINGKEQELKVQGVIVEIGSIPSAGFDKLTEKNKWNEIIIHEDKERYISNLTSVDGIFAAGDVTDVPEKQIIVAAGEGVKAVLGIFKYLNKPVRW